MPLGLMSVEKSNCDLNESFSAGGARDVQSRKLHLHYPYSGNFELHASAFPYFRDSSSLISCKMFNVLRKETPTSKLYVSQAQLSNKFDLDQPPSKKKPFSTIINQPFTHSVVCLVLTPKLPLTISHRPMSFFQRSCMSWCGTMSSINSGLWSIPES